MTKDIAESIGAAPLREESSADYWNDRLDPFDWKERVLTDDERRWREAHAAFLAPDTLEALAMLEPLEGKRLLELGCAQGYGSLHFAQRGARVVGVDLSHRRCAVALRQSSAISPLRPSASGSATEPPRFAGARAERLPFADGSFDLVFCRDVLMYTEPTRVARECERVLATGGRVVFIESLEGHALLRWYRRCTSPAAYRRFTRHLRWSDLAAVGQPLHLSRITPHYLVSLVAFFFLFVLRSRKLYRATLRALVPADHWLLSRWPALARFAWRGTALYVKPSHAT